MSGSRSPTCCATSSRARSIFLTLLLREWREWTAEASEQLGDDVAATLASTLAARALFCDLLSEQAAVLERNVSADTVRAFRGATIELVHALAAAIAGATALTTDDAFELLTATLTMTAGLWPLTNPRSARGRDVRRHRPAPARLRGPPAPPARDADRRLQRALKMRVNQSSASSPQARVFRPGAQVLRRVLDQRVAGDQALESRRGRQPGNSTPARRMMSMTSCAISP